jgi:hypothetical protein
MVAVMASASAREPARAAAPGTAAVLSALAGPPRAQRPQRAGEQVVEEPAQRKEHALTLALREAGPVLSAGLIRSSCSLYSGLVR